MADLLASVFAYARSVESGDLGDDEDRRRVAEFRAAMAELAEACEGLSDG